MAVDVQTRPGFTFAKATPLPIDGTLQIHPERNYDITPDGKQFLVLLTAPVADSDDRPPLQINVVLNWFEELKQRVPVK